jgi:hypothetical protein
VGVNNDLSIERLEMLDDDRLLAVARNVKNYEQSEDLSDLVLELAGRFDALLYKVDALEYENHRCRKHKP